MKRDHSAYWNKWARVWNPFLRVVGLDRRYRREGVNVLQLEKGAVVLDIACGTGFNFPYLTEAVGPAGHIVAVDISPGMLEHARAYAIENNWRNIEFILGDVSEIRLPNADAAAAFWCMISFARYPDALHNIASCLKKGGRLAVLDFKTMEAFPGSILNPILRMIGRATQQDVTRMPWLDMKGLLTDVQMKEWKYGGLLLGNAYLAWGRR